MALDDKQKEHLQSIHNAAGDIQRWAMQQLAADRVSQDRLRDTHQMSVRISELTSRLEFERPERDRPT